MIKVFLKSGKDEPVRRFHPWVFSGAIARVEGEPADGDIAGVYDRRGDLLGVGHFHHGSIAVRILNFGPADLESEQFWVERLESARKVRDVAIDISSDPTAAGFRLVHGEGDGLSGLIVDMYGGTAVVQCHSIGMHRQREVLAVALRTVFGDKLKAIYDKSKEALPPKYAGDKTDGYLWTLESGPESTAIISENGVRFKVNWETGQKTGFFLDQRDNRRLLAQFVSGKTVLNTFCYTGGFSCYALKAGAALVHSVDVSAKAMELTAENAALNEPYPGMHTCFTDDVQRFLKATEQRYEVMVVDPPAFAKSIEKRHNAVQGYKRLNAAALEKMSPGGIMFTFSCSQVVDRQLFYNTIVAAALEAGRQVRVLHHLTQSADHPVSIFHPEGAYLKGLVLYVT